VGDGIDPVASDSTLGGLGGKMPAQAWHALLANGTPRRYVKGEMLVRQGESGEHVLAVNYGLVKVTRLEFDGHEMVLSVRGRGEVIGEATYLGNQARSATVTAMRVCVTYIVPHLTFRRIIEEFGLSSLVLRHLTDRLRESEEMRSELANLPPRRRIARLLLRFSHGDELTLAQTDLARAVGLSRSAVALELAWLRDHGLVTTSRGRVRITDRLRLLHLAADLAGG
jgi:CRP/FNR family transcriptional regulator, cyclic AMP receptor protein